MKIKFHKSIVYLAFTSSLTNTSKALSVMNQLSSGLQDAQDPIKNQLTQATSQTQAIIQGQAETQALSTTTTVTQTLEELKAQAASNSQALQEANNQFKQEINGYASQAVNQVAPGMGNLGKMLKNTAEKMLKDAVPSEFAGEEDCCPRCPDPFDPQYYPQPWPLPLPYQPVPQQQQPQPAQQVLLQQPLSTQPMLPQQYPVQPPSNYDPQPHDHHSSAHHHSHHSSHGSHSGHLGHRQGDFYAQTNSEQWPLLQLSQQTAFSKLAAAPKKPCVCRKTIVQICSEDRARVMANTPPPPNPIAYPSPIAFPSLYPAH